MNRAAKFCQEFLTSQPKVVRNINIEILSNKMSISPCSIKTALRSSVRNLRLFSEREFQTKISVCYPIKCPFHFSRRQSRHASSLKHFFCEGNLCRTRRYKETMDFSYESDIGNGSNNDHFFLTSNLRSSQLECEILHDADNFSDHGAISLRGPITIEHTLSSASAKPVCLKWDEGDEDSVHEYVNELSDNLTRIRIPTGAIRCYDAFCCIHADAVTQYHDDIVNGCIEELMTT